MDSTNKIVFKIRKHFLAKVFIQAIVCLFTSTSSIEAQINPLDTVDNTLSKLKAEMSEKFNMYKSKYPTGEVGLRAVTVYEYDKNNEMICEKTFSTPANYTRDLYANKQVIQSLKIYYGDKSLVLNAYDSAGRLTEKVEYNKGRKEEKEVYSFESKSNKTKDTITSRRFINGRLEWKFVDIKVSELIHEEYAYHYSEDKLDSKRVYYISADKKYVEKEFYTSYWFKYETERQSFYDNKGLLLRSVEKRTDDKGIKEEESVNYYNEKDQLVKNIKKESGKETIMRDNEYDARGNLISEKAYNANGNMIYRCIYEYDSQNNKIVYLYFYIGEK